MTDPIEGKKRGFILCMTPPDGAPTEYMPEGYGFTTHAHTLDRAQAEILETPVMAKHRGDRYRWPPAFWNGEREHAERMRAKFARWTFTVEPA